MSLSPFAPFSFGLLASAAVFSACGSAAPSKLQDAGHEASTDAGPVDAGPVDAGPPLSLQILEIPMPVDLTADGRTALVQDNNSPTNDVYFLDVETQQLSLKTSTGDFEHPVLTIAGNGSRIGGFYGTPIEAATWTSADGWKSLPTTFGTNCDPMTSAAWDLNADGTIAVGLAWDGCTARAARWTGLGGTPSLVPLQHMGTGSDRATKISDDGALMGGFSQSDVADRTPTVWYADGHGLLLDPGGEAVGEVLSVSGDGALVAGIWNQAGFAWSESGGVIMLGALPTALPSDPTHPNAIAANHRLIFGGQGDPFSGTPLAFVWTEHDGMRSLGDLVTAQGLSIPAGYVLGNVLAASADGSVLLGAAIDTTTPLPTQHAFVLRMPISVYGVPSAP
jgi:uncharacterized membrane protein